MLCGNMAASHYETTGRMPGAMEAVLAFIAAILAHARKATVALHNKLADTVPEYAEAHQRHSHMLVNPDDTMGIVDEARMFGAAVVVIAITVVVVNEVLTVDIISNSSGPFTGVINDLETTGVAAMGLLVVGLLVVAGRVVMGFMGGGGGGF